MKEIERDSYLNKIKRRRGTNLVKVLSGMRRVGKSYLLDPIYKNYLLAQGVSEDHIIKVDLDDLENIDLVEPMKLYQYIRAKIIDSQRYYVLLDEIQLVPEFEKVLNSLLHVGNLDVYVTGSNSKFLSSDIVTEFRGRSDEIRVYPLSFGEFLSTFKGDKFEAWDQYLRFGGLPLVLDRNGDEEKNAYLEAQKDNVYLNDIIERYKIRNRMEFYTLVEIVASSIGSPLNPNKLERSFKSIAGVELSYHTIEDYLNKLEDAFIIEQVKRYDVKGKKYINTPSKYYFTDIGIRNSFLHFRQIEENHIMENVIYNELRRRGFSVDVGVVEVREGGIKKQLEVDFVANKGSNRYYIQSALTIGETEKKNQETRSLNNIDDYFKKIIITKDLMSVRREENGIVTMGLFNFLLDSQSLER